MNRVLLIAMLFAASIFAAAPAKEPENAAPPEETEGKSILDLADWTRGPKDEELGSYATIQVLEGYIFTDGEGTRKVLEAMGNPTSGSELGMMTKTNSSWFVLFRFNDVGYVKDDDKDKLDPNELLKSIREGTEESNKARAKMGAPPMKIIGWEIPPTYNEQTRNLEWAVRGESEGEPVVNYNTRILGRSGVMEAKLVVNPDELKETLPAFQQILKGYSYKGGETYAEYRQGDKVAKYGLAALITGGAAAVAVKTGLMASIILFFKKGAKLIIVAVIALGAFIKKVAFGGRRREM